MFREKIAELVRDYPDWGRNVIPLKGRPELRLRVQDWRVIFHVEDDILWIDEVGPRGSIYGD